MKKQDKIVAVGLLIFGVCTIALGISIGIHLEIPVKDVLAIVSMTISGTTFVMYALQALERNKDR